MKKKKKPVSKGYTLYDSIYKIDTPEITKLQIWRTDLWLPARIRERGRGDGCGYKGIARGALWPQNSSVS